MSVKLSEEKQDDYNENKARNLAVRNLRVLERSVFQYARRVLQSGDPVEYSIANYDVGISRGRRTLTIDIGLRDR